MAYMIVSADWGWVAGLSAGRPIPNLEHEDVLVGVGVLFLLNTSFLPAGRKAIWPGVGASV